MIISPNIMRKTPFSHKSSFLTNIYRKLIRDMVYLLRKHLKSHQKRFVYWIQPLEVKNILEAKKATLMFLLSIRTIPATRRSGSCESKDYGNYNWPNDNLGLTRPTNSSPATPHGGEHPPHEERINRLITPDTIFIPSKVPLDERARATRNLKISPLKNLSKGLRRWSEEQIFEAKCRLLSETPLQLHSRVAWTTPQWCHGIDSRFGRNANGWISHTDAWFSH